MPKQKKSGVMDAAELAGITKYFGRAERLKFLYQQCIFELVSKYGPEFLSIVAAKDSYARRNGYSREVISDITLLQDSILYLDYWHSALWIVVEGYHHIGAHDRDIARVLSNPLTPKLKKYRNGTQHFTKELFNKNALELITIDGAYKWVSELQDAFHAFFDRLYRESMASLNYYDPMDFLIEEARRVGATFAQSPQIGELPSSYPQSQNRNSRCGCGSGKRFKECHGRV